MLFSAVFGYCLDVRKPEAIANILIRVSRDVNAKRVLFGILQISSSTMEQGDSNELW